MSTNFDLTTPALLFPAISLLLLAYTNRFLTIASLIRKLPGEVPAEQRTRLMVQINNLRLRIKLIRWMQLCGVASFFTCVLVMFLLFGGYLIPAKIIFSTSLVLLMSSLGFSLWEVGISVKALDVHLDMVAAQGLLE